MSLSATDRRSLATLRDEYFRFALQRNPVTATFLGGDGWDPGLAEANARLRDARPSAIADEVRFYRGLERELAAIDRSRLEAGDVVDADVLAAHLRFLIHQLDELRYFERSVDTYVAEPFRGVDWQIQQMIPLRGPGASDAPDGVIGTDEEWQRVVERVQAIPGFVAVAVDNLRAGVAAGNVPDARMVERDGIAGGRADAEYFRAMLPGVARPHLGGTTARRRILANLAAAADQAAAAFEGFVRSLEEMPRATGDRYAIGEAEHEWRVRNDLGLERSAQELWEYGGGEVAVYRERLLDIAGEIGRRRSLGLRFGTEAERVASVAGVIEELGRDAPANDDERLAWFIDIGHRAVEYGRDRALFDVPDDYRLEIVPTPPLLRATLEAAYYPAAPLKRSGALGRFYVTPTGNDPAALALNGRASIAAVAVHEGFPGHDWHYRSMAARGDAISNIRWLTPGAVEDSSSMWADSMSIEGWGLYAEALMAEPTEASPYGFYSLEDQFYYLYWGLRRAMRVRVDVGIHTGRMTFDEAVDWWAANQDFAPDARDRAEADPAARSILESAERNIYRYSKWPTQAITYNLGRRSITDLRDRYLARIEGATPRRFHEWYLGQGTVPAGYLTSLL